jgi:hypothetical protein
MRGTIRKRARNGLQNARDIPQDIVVPETQYPIVVTRKPLIANDVVRVISVLPSIHLNDEASLAANKVDGVWADRFLPNELVSVERAGPKPSSQGAFGISCIAS